MDAIAHINKFINNDIEIALLLYIHIELLSKNSIVGPKQ
jgi:hypothetical protein